MSKTATPAKSRKKTTKEPEKSPLMESILEGIFAKKGEKITSIDLTRIPESVADCFIITEASSPTQVKAIADSVQDVVLESTGEKPYRVEGRQHANWILIDYINIVLHIMLPNIRNFYQLEEMWSDAPAKEHTEN